MWEGLWIPSLESIAGLIAVTFDIDSCLSCLRKIWRRIKFGELQTTRQI